MLGRFSLVSALTILACDTANPGDVPTMGSPTANAGSGGVEPGGGGSGGSTGGLGIDLPGLGGIGNGVAGALAGSDNPDGGIPAMGSAGGNSSTGGAGGGDLPRFYHYIRSNPYSKLVFEIDRVEGQEPHETISTRIAERFAELLDKPGGVEVVLDDTLPANGDDFVWTDTALDEISRLSFDGDPDPDTIAIHITYLDGRSSYDGEDGSVILGVAWNWLHIAMFKQTIESSCGGLGLLGGLREQACEEAEFSILSHEIGHVLGLVDNGLPMVDDHRDPESEHGAHDFDPECVMYWAYEGQGLFDRIGSRLLAGEDTSLPFCQHCLDDLNALR